MTDDAAPLTPAVFHILLALADGPLHGYAVMQAVEQSAGGSIPVGPGTIYGCLQRMEDSGLVREVEASEVRRRRAFELTAPGRRALEAEAARVTELARVVRARKLVPSKG
jgi:DNA-binding PadR family transcriptional regulator